MQDFGFVSLLPNKHHKQPRCLSSKMQSASPMSGSTENSPRRITIPKHSFTAFRITYSSSREISELARCIFLGRVPDVWLEGKLTGGLLLGAAKRVKSVVSRNFNSTISTIHQSIYNSVLSDEVSDQEEGTDDFNFHNRRRLAKSVRDAYMKSWQDSDTEEEPESVEIESDAVSDSDLEMSHSYFEHILNRRSSASSGGSWDSESHASSLSSVHGFEPLAGPNGGPTRLVSQSTGPEITGPPAESELKPHVEPQVEPISLLTTSRAGSIVLLDMQKVRFDKSTKSKPRISFANPEPECETVQNELSKEYILAENRHLKSLRKLRGLATKSTGKAKAKGSRVKLKLVSSILKGYRPGEIIRMDKMLVLIEKADSITGMDYYTEATNVDTRVTDRWREYYVLLRKTDNSSTPLEVQLFDANSRDLEGKPDHTLALSPKVKADFFCRSDKSISLVEPVKDGVRLFLLNAKFQTVAFKWLFVVKGIVQDEMDTTFNIKIAELDMQFRVCVSREILRKSVELSVQFHLIERPSGYQVEFDVMLEFLKDELFSRLKGIAPHHEGVRQWLASNSNPWFCFRFYDRLEWVKNNSKYFYVQNQVQSEKINLEFRKMTRTPLLTVDPEGGELQQPYPIEGFLARITNTSGKEFSKFRAFYRIQYFFTSDSILFFSNLFNGVPPSPDNAFMDDLNNKEEIAPTIPAIYLKDPFPLDKDDHISWIDSPEFEKYDKLAVDEFERRVQQVVKAIAIIDLCSVRAVRSIPLKSIRVHHLYYQSLLWFSSPTLLEDEDIMDSAFEIELLDGSSSKLLAPSRIVRDEWVWRLLELVIYWKNHRNEELKSKILTRNENWKRLGINEYMDSNIVNKSEGLEEALSAANSHVFNIGGLAMSTPVLMDGYLYQKHKKHSNFNQYYVILCPGYLKLFSLNKRSKATGIWKKTPYFEHYMTIQISECYAYSGNATSLDLVENNAKAPGQSEIPRVYADGWKSSGEDSQQCFTLWFGKKRRLKHEMGLARNPGSVHMIRKLGITGKSMVFLARSRQDREAWMHQILVEINRFSKG